MYRGNCSHLTIFVLLHDHQISGRSQVLACLKFRMVGIPNRTAVLEPRENDGAVDLV